jgi:prophage regulatory protein
MSASPDELSSVRPKQAAELLGIGTATFWRWAKEREDFPAPKRLSARCTVFNTAELLRWRDAQVAPLNTTNPNPRVKVFPGSPVAEVEAAKATLDAKEALQHAVSVATSAGITKDALAPLYDALGSVDYLLRTMLKGASR